ncbi:MAG TPA: hypothetical protein VIT38_03580 [Allosphingosinicella sp.]
MKRFSPIAAVAASLAAPALAAQTQSPETGKDEGQTITVQGRTEQAVERFVRSVTQVDRGRQLSRWNGHVCPKVLGLDPGHAAFIVNRINATARRHGIPVARGNCPGNIIIVVTAEADEFATLLAQRYPRLFGDPDAGMASPGEIARLVRPRPVRWLTGARTGNSEGRQRYDGATRIYSASRLTLSTRENAGISFAIVDAGRLERISWGQLADYLSLATLARPSMDADYDAATVLSIFAMRERGETGPPGLTAQDDQLLEALYATDAAVQAERQREQIETQIQRGAEARPEPEG